MAHQCGGEAVYRAAGVRRTQRHRVQHPGRTAGLCESHRKSLEAGNELWYVWSSFVCALINLTDCAKAGASVKQEEFDAFLIPPLFFRVLRWTSRPPNWSLAQASTSASCWTDWLRRRSGREASPSGSMPSVFFFSSGCFCCFCVYRSFFYFFLSLFQDKLPIRKHRRRVCGGGRRRAHAQESGGGADRRCSAFV